MKNRLQVIAFAITLTFAHSAAQTTYGIYFGDIHCHTWYSDGNQDQNQATYTVPVARAITYARDVAGNMDFLGVSDHNHNESLNMTMAHWRAGFVEADSVNQDGVFVGFFGQEWGTIGSGGHSLIYGTEKLFGWNPGLFDVYVAKGDYAHLFDSLKKYNGFCYFAHPQQTDFAGIFSGAYNANWDSVVQGVALKNGPATSTNTTETNPSGTTYEDRYHDLLRIGYHVAPIANQDNHNTTYGRVNQQRTVVLASSYSKAGIVEGLRNRRAYATEDHNLQLRFEVGTHQMGELVSQAGPIPIRVKVVDPDNSMSSIVLRYGIPGSGSAPTTLTSVSNVDSLVISQPQAVGTTYYYYAYVTNSGGRHAWSAPIWITVPSGPLPGAFPLSTPTSGSSSQPVSGTLTWLSSPNATQYDVYLDMNNPPVTLVSGNQTDTFYNYSGLSNNALYRWKVVAKNGNGSTVATGAPWSFTTIIAAPGSFTQSSPSNGISSQPVSGTLSWQPSPNASQYDVYLDTNISPSHLVSAAQAGTSFDYSGLEYNRNYFWKIVAKNVVDSIVATGSPWLFTTAGPPPASFSLASPSDGAAGQPLSGTVTWTVSANATAYDLYLDQNNPPATIVGPDLADTSYPYSSLSPGSTYYWKVIAKNPDGTLEATGSPRSFTLLSVPAAPSAISSDNVTTSGLDLMWNDNADNETGYRVYRSDDDLGPYSQLGADLPSNTVLFADTGLAVNQRYYYRIVPFNGLGEGEYASASVATHCFTPGAPQVTDPGFLNATVTINAAGNPSWTEFALRVSEDSTVRYVQSDGTLNASPVWQTLSEWGGGSGVVVNGLHPCVNHAFSVAGRNLDNVPTPFGDSTDQTPTCSSVSQSTIEGWNLMSLPVTVTDPRKVVVFPTSSSDAFFYQGSYVAAESLRYGEGFWLKFNGSEEVSLAGEPRPEDTVHLRQGWNIIGSFANPVPTSSLTTQPNGIVISEYFGFDGAYAVTDSLRPLKGYWVKASAPGVLVLAPSLGQLSGQTLVKANDAELNSLTFEDRAGHQQRLYIDAQLDASRKELHSELPPLPPPNVFDVRFRSQRFREAVAFVDGHTVRFPIDIQSSSYPVRMRWDFRSGGTNAYSLDDGVRRTPIRGTGELLFENPIKDIHLIVENSDNGSTPRAFGLQSNFPNPFNPSTSFRYDLPARSSVRFTILNAVGEEVAVLVNEVQNPGSWEVRWEANNMPSGVYFYQLRADRNVASGKMLLIK